ncbi:hydrogenase maturation protease [Thioalkalivibrio sp. XN279]|uniref:hydrogenase maturation protease n=1 Tax=Thioalkalivibrio sp. XN279 TaxID=2714953 RepID=UPI00140AF9C7|nr:hydrogenase maturation protease [Thioalkalivibrio sp. XN279]NHA13649.1 hydrogenase maturation protease [Thioalkalivibrio sp. XN279]
MSAPVVVFAVGNPSRGDDAIGPALAARLEAEDLAEVEVVVDFQLQVEHALDLDGRDLAIFVDAAVGVDPPYDLKQVRPSRDRSHTSHALSPAAVLETFERCTGKAAPPAWVLAVRGESFELGTELSAAARANLEAAWHILRALSAGPALGP